MTLSQTYISRKQLLVDNLVAKGVTGYTVNDGLTTLINAVLEIQGGGGVRTLTLTSDKDFLSYADSESATLTATLLEDGEPVTGETVEFFNGSTSMGTAQTDSNGVAVKTYTSTGAGDVSLKAEADNGMLVSEIFVVYDYPYYADSMSKIKNTFIKNTSVSGRTIYLSSFTFNSDVEIEFKLKNIPQSWLVGFGSDGTTWNSKGVWFKIQNYNQNKASVMYADTGGTVRDVSITTSYDTSTVFTIKSENTHKIYWYLNSTVQASRDTSTSLPLGLRFDVFDNQDYDIDYIKVKPL